MRNAKAGTLFFLTLLLFIIPALSANAGELSPGLRAMLDDTPTDQPVSVLVHFTDRADIQALSQELTARKATRKRRHAEIVYSLQDAARIQDDLALELDTATDRDGILGYTRYWIANVMVVYAIPAEIERIAQRAEVDYIEPNFVPELIEPVSIESANGGRAEMDSRGIGTTPGISAIRAPEVWEQLGIDGSGSIIGSLDTGVDGTHPSFASRWRGNEADASECWLDVLGGGTTFPVDNHGHGTHTVGTMAGVALDDTIGVAPGASWIATNAINQGGGNELDNDVIACFQWFTDPDGNPETIVDVPDVVQNSWGVNENFSGYFDCDDRWWDVIDNCEAAGVVVVFSAGNEGPGAGTLRSPSDRASTIYNCFSVGSTLHTAPYSISGFSSRGPTTCAFVDPAVSIKPEVSAPGSDIYSAQPGGGYQNMSGTSMAGPHVSGVVALMRQANPNLEVNALKQILMDTAVDLGAAGEDNTYGWGIIDAFAAVEASMYGFGTLTGQITNDSYDNGPLSGARIELVGRAGYSTSNANGNYITSVPAGEYTVIVSLEGFETQELSGINIVEDLETTLDIVLHDNAGPALSNPTGELATSDNVGPYPVSVFAYDASAVDNVILNWKIAQASTWNSIEMNPSEEGIWSAAIPGHPANTEIIYYYLGADGNDRSSFLPESAPGEFFTLLITENMYLTDAEEPGDPEWLIGVPGDEATSGLWVREDPVGTEYNGAFVQPENDHTIDPGVACFVTGNANPGDGAGTEDVDGGCTTLQTPVFDLSGVDRAVVKYWCWYGEDGFSIDDDFVVEISNDNGNSWVELDRIVDNAASWNQVNVEINTLQDGSFALTDQIVIRFLACDFNNGGLVEAAIDDFAIETFSSQGLSAVDDTPEVMAPVILRQNHPNPFNPTTTIAFSLPRATQAELAVFTISGRRVVTLVNESMTAGEHQVSWNGQDSSGRQIASGAYFYRLSTGDNQLVKRMVLVK
ncbi:MAG: S8 family serine peptidase [bacterium]|nr:S8 family serine peptidase [bacterium]